VVVGRTFNHRNERGLGFIPVACEIFLAPDMQRAAAPVGARLGVVVAWAQAASERAVEATDQRASMWVRPDASVTATQVQTGALVIVCLLM
jgi:hypothetical protein